MLKITKKLAGFKLKLWQKWLGLKTFLRNKKTALTKKTKSRNLARKLLLLLGVALFLFLLSGIAVFAFFAKDLPSPEKISQRQMIESTKIFDRTGTVLLYEIHGEEKRTVVPLSEISPFLINATLATEDAKFYDHIGIDFKGIIRGGFLSLTGHSLQSGSTITQQFIKSSVLTPEQTFSRKAKEIILAIEMELQYSKDEILGLYLNQIPYGSNLYGVETAAWGFFNKPAKDLTLAESAVLAALPKAPTYYSPHGSHPDKMKARQEYILDRMASLEMITAEQAQAAKSETLVFADFQHGIKAPHFVMNVKEYLEEKYGQDYIERAGLSIYTTLDWELQVAGEKAVTEGAAKNETRYNAQNAALTAVDPKTGQILAMVGSRDYFDLENDGNVNVVLSPRQPGSSFKPFAYATAFQKGFTPQTIVFNTPTNFSDDPANPYTPQNYNGTFTGPVSLKSALAQSLNIPAVKVLYLAGIKDTINQAHKMGITTLQDEDSFGLALVLGGGEVKLLDEVSAYGVFATEGILNKPAAILKVVDREGKVVEEFKADSSRALEAQTARQISDILSDNSARAPIFGQNSALTLGNIVAAAKTGTTNKYKDAWTVGYTPSLAAGVWVGNNSSAEMKPGADGSVVAAPIWSQFMKEVYRIKETAPAEKKSLENYFQPGNRSESFQAPEPVAPEKPMLNGNAFSEQTVKVDSVSGKLATAFTPSELIIEKTFKQVHNILFYVDKDDPLGDIPENPAVDPQYDNWEAGVRAWFNNPENCQSIECAINEQPPTEEDDVHTGQSFLEVKINSPINGQTVNGNNLTVSLQIDSEKPVRQVDYYLDGTLVLSRFSGYLSNSLRLNGLAAGRHLLKIKVYDEVLNSGEEELFFFTEKNR